MVKFVIALLVLVAVYAAEGKMLSHISTGVCVWGVCVRVRVRVRVRVCVCV